MSEDHAPETKLTSFGDTEDEVRDASRLLELHLGPMTLREAKVFEALADDFGKRLTEARELFGGVATQRHTGSAENPVLACGHTEAEHAELAEHLPPELRELMDLFAKMGQSAAHGQAAVHDALGDDLLHRNPFQTEPGRA